jgi:hypothetical protein
MKKVLSLFSLALIPTIFAAPAEDVQVILGDIHPVERPAFQGLEGIIDQGSI